MYLFEVTWGFLALAVSFDGQGMGVWVRRYWWFIGTAAVKER